MTDRELLEFLQSQIAAQLGAPPVVVPPVITPPPPPPPPPPAGNYIPFDLKLSGADVLRLHSGQIASAVLPNVKDAGERNSGQIIFGEATVSPRAAIVEICISRSRGVIDPASGDYYLRTDNPTFTKLSWIERPIPAWGARNDEIVGIYHIAKAYTSEGPWYVNVRYTYAASDCQHSPCGFVQQWNFEAY